GGPGAADPALSRAQRFRGRAHGLARPRRPGDQRTPRRGGAAVRREGRGGAAGDARTPVLRLVLGSDVGRSLTEAAMEIRTITEGLQFPEGPVAMADGSVILVEIAARTVTRVAPDGAKTIVAGPGGGPNGAAVGPDGKCYVANNGGFEF